MFEKLLKALYLPPVDSPINGAAHSAQGKICFNSSIIVVISLLSPKLDPLKAWVRTESILPPKKLKCLLFFSSTHFLYTVAVICGTNTFIFPDCSGSLF